MKKLTLCQNVLCTLLCSLPGLATQCLAQTAESAGTVTPTDAALGSLGQTNIWVIAALVVAVTAIVLALIFRKKPSTMSE